MLICNIFFLRSNGDKGKNALYIKAMVKAGTIQLLYVKETNTGECQEQRHLIREVQDW